MTVRPESTHINDSLYPSGAYRYACSSFLYHAYYLVPLAYGIYILFLAHYRRIRSARPFCHRVYFFTDPPHMQELGHKNLAPLGPGPKVPNRVPLGSHAQVPAPGASSALPLVQPFPHALRVPL